MSDWRSRGKIVGKSERAPKESVGNDWRSRGRIVGKTLSDVAPTNSVVDSALEVGGAALDMIDAPASVARSAIYGAEKDGFSGMKDELYNYGKTLLNEGPSAAVDQAPTGKDIAIEAGISDKEVPIAGIGSPSVSPAGILGLMVEMTADPLNLIPTGAISKLSKPIRLAAKSRGEKKTASLLSRMINAENIKEGIDPNVLAKQLFEDDLVSYINKPKELYRRLGGNPSVETITEGGESAFRRGERTTGVIGKESERLENFLTAIEDSEEVPSIIPSKAIGSSAINELIRPMKDVLGGAAVDNGKLEAASDLISRQLKKDTYTISEMRELKKNINKEINSKEYYKGADEKVALDKEVKMEIVRALDRAIETALTGKTVKFGGKTVDAANYYKLQNARISNHLKLKRLLDGAEIDSLRKEDIGEMITRASVGGLAGYGLGEAAGFPLAGAAIGGVYAAGKKAGEIGAKVYNPSMAKGSKVIEKLADPALRATPQIQREMTQPEGRVNRSPQSVEQPIAEQLIRTPLPRDAERIIQNKDFVMAKIAQQAPEMFDQLRDVLTNDPDAIDDLLPMIVQQMPQLFERDKYNRINGKIMDPAMAEAARRDTMNNEEMSMLQKTQKINKLNKTGYFNDN